LHVREKEVAMRMKEREGKSERRGGKEAGRKETQRLA
jgi:hypothetical protein